MTQNLSHGLGCKLETWASRGLRFVGAITGLKFGVFKGNVTLLPSCFPKSGVPFGVGLQIGIMLQFGGVCGEPLSVEVNNKVS